MNFRQEQAAITLSLSLSHFLPQTRGGGLQVQGLQTQMVNLKRSHIAFNLGAPQPHHEAAFKRSPTKRALVFFSQNYIWEKKGFH